VYNFTAAGWLQHLFPTVLVCYGYKKYLN